MGFIIGKDLYSIINIVKNISIMENLKMKLKTESGTYTINKPTGRIGAKNFAIMTSAAPTTQGEKDKAGNVIVSEGDMERMSAAFEKWSAEVLPNIVKDGPFTYNDMPGSDQYAAFIASMEAMEGDIGEELFQVIE